MKRLTMSLDDDLADAFEALVRSRGYANRSEAFRDLLRNDLMGTLVQSRPEAICVATLSYVYNHHQRQLASRLTELQHDHHELTVSTMHAHLDHDRCVETIILRGHADELQAFAQSVITQPGVTHGHLHVVSLATSGESPHAPLHASRTSMAAKARKRRLRHKH